MREVERAGRAVAAAAVQLAAPSGEAIDRAIELLSVATQRVSVLTAAMREGAIPPDAQGREAGEAAWNRVRLETRRVSRLVAQLNDHADEQLRAIETGPRRSLRG